MLLAMDVGNTNTVIGLFAGDDLLCHWRVTTDKHRTTDEHGVLLNNLFQFHGRRFEEVRGVAISCVVPPLRPTLERLSRRYMHQEAFLVEAGVKTDLPLLVDHPAEVGADRLVNAVAGFRKYGGPLVLVDFGTATTFDVISRDGAFLGGAIAPGIQISLEALFLRTAKLPRIEVIEPKQVIGKNTIQYMQAGIYFGYAGLIEGIVRQMWNEIGEECRVIATGGLAGLMARACPSIHVLDPFLTLEGLRIIYQLNHPQG